MNGIDIQALASIEDEKTKSKVAKVIQTDLKETAEEAPIKNHKNKQFVKKGLFDGLCVWYIKPVVSIVFL